MMVMMAPMAELGPVVASVGMVLMVSPDCRAVLAAMMLLMEPMAPRVLPRSMEVMAEPEQTATTVRPEPTALMVLAVATGRLVPMEVPASMVAMAPTARMVVTAVLVFRSEPTPT